MRFFTLAAVLALLAGAIVGASAQATSGRQRTTKTTRTSQVTTTSKSYDTGHARHHTRVARRHHMRHHARTYRRGHYVYHHGRRHYVNSYRRHHRMHVSGYSSAMGGVLGMQIDYNVPGAPGSNPPPTEPNAANDNRGLPYTPNNNPGNNPNNPSK